MTSEATVTATIIADMMAAAALRSLDILESWIRKRRGHFVTEVTADDRVRLVLIENGRPDRRFHGVSIQDAYAQAAQTICLEEYA